MAHGDGPHLPDARQLAAHEPGRARSDMTVDALHTRVRRALESGELRLHDMAGLAAEAHRFHVGDRSIRNLAGDDDVQKGCDGSEDDQPPELRILHRQWREGSRLVSYFSC